MVRDELLAMGHAVRIVDDWCPSWVVAKDHRGPGFRRADGRRRSAMGWSGSRLVTPDDLQTDGGWLDAARIARCEPRHFRHAHKIDRSRRSRGAAKIASVQFVAALVNPGLVCIASLTCRLAQAGAP